MSWLKLGTEQILELECGEDIDLLAPAIAGQSQDFERTVTQVKCLDHNLTLRSVKAREALASFSDHLNENASLQLRFRFLTNAFPGEEDPPEPLSSVPGILLWESIRTSSITPRQRVTAMESLARFLQGLKSPGRERRNPKTNELLIDKKAASWQEFVALTKDPTRFEEFVSKFEWSMGEDGPVELVNEVQQALTTLGHVANPRDAQSRHDQLFVFVMRMLATRPTGS